MWFALGVGVLGSGVISAGWGIVQGHLASLILRDVIAFLFVLMPLLYRHLLVSEQDTEWLLRVLVLVGGIFALRSIDASLSLFLWPFASGALDYFGNLPTVLFAGLIMMSVGMQRIMTGRRLSDLIMIIAMLLGVALIIMAFGLNTQRASFAAMAVFGMTTTVMAIMSRPYQSWRIMALIGLLALVSWPIMQQIVDLLLSKTAAVGGNMRVQEWMAVWGAVSDNIATIILGLGSGGMFDSPAVGGLPVNFTHGLLSSALLKTGILGLLLTVSYIAALVWPLLQRAQNPRAQAALWPILICTFFYASFKSLDFGLVLLLSTALYRRNP